MPTLALTTDGLLVAQSAQDQAFGILVYPAMALTSLILAAAMSGVAMFVVPGGANLAARLAGADKPVLIKPAASFLIALMTLWMSTFLLMALSELNINAFALGLIVVCFAICAATIFYLAVGQMPFTHALIAAVMFTLIFGLIVGCTVGVVLMLAG